MYEILSLFVSYFLSFFVVDVLCEIRMKKEQRWGETKSKFEKEKLVLQKLKTKVYP